MQAAPHCYEVAVGYYGQADERGRAPVESVSCPAPLVTVILPPDTTRRTSPAPNAQQVAITVLRSLPHTPPAPAVIAGRIASELSDPAGEYVSAAEPKVLVDGTDVGVSTGAGTDCVLVRRSDGVTGSVHVSPPQLQPGEWGCRPETAMHPPAPAH